MKIAFLLSGSGSTFENLLAKIKEMNTPAEIAVVISSKMDAYGIQRAKKHGIPYEVVEYKKYKSDLNKYSELITEIIEKYEAGLVVMGGFMSLYKIPDKLNNKVLNVHPALIPAFCGKNMYGEKVHEAVFKEGVKVTGCTVHFVDNQYDHGPIIAQKAVYINEDDNVETIAEKVVGAERELYPRVIDAFVRGKLKFRNGKPFIIK